MSWRINNIRIKNFKFFKDEFVLNVNGKHLLLYGENGSGKSSIYWSFYTHYQSCYKLPIHEEAQKYFMVVMIKICVTGFVMMRMAHRLS